MSFPRRCATGWLAGGALGFLLWATPSVAVASSAWLGEEQRLWLGELELRGPLREAVLECGGQGSVRLRAELLAGEVRRLSVPLPVRSPLGVSGLAAVPAPGIVVPQGEGGAARWSGWSKDQPEAALAAVPPGLRARSTPTASRRQDVVAPQEVALLVGALLLVAAIRRRPRVALGVGAGAAVGLALLALGRSSEGVVVWVLEVDAEAGRAVEVRAGEDSLALGTWGESPEPGLELRVEPPDRAIDLDLAPAAGGYRARARAEGARLVWVRPAAAPALRPEENGWASLEETWTRDAAGRWARHGPWARREALPSAPNGPEASPAGSRAAPPGWSAAGLPPGRAVLVGRVAADRSPGRPGGPPSGQGWVRVVGFPLRRP